MSVSIKTAREIELMKEAGRLLEQVHDELAKAIKPGISTWEIDHLGEELIRSFGCTPNFLHYNGYPASICVSVNDEVVHGIPSKERILQEEILSAWMPDSSIKVTILMLPVPMRWERSARRQNS